MKMQNVSLDDIVRNPWRDIKLYPLNTDEAVDHIKQLRESIDDHGFFGGVKGRRRNGKVEIACGHMRIEAARKLKLESVPIFVGDMDDDQMLRLMTDENATQSGSNPGAIMNEVAAITRRLVEVLLSPPTDHLASIGAKCFEGKKGYETASGKLMARFNDPDKDGGVGWRPILRYLGDGNEDNAHRSKRQIIDAISSLKQTGRYDDIVDEAMAKYPPPVIAEINKSKTAVVAKPRKPRQRKLDERCASAFPNDHQFQAFRDAVTTPAAQKVIGVDQQYALAKTIMKQPPPKIGKSWNGATEKKQIGAPYIKMMVQEAVKEGMAKQRDLDKEEKERFLREQTEARIADELHSANASVRSLISAIARLISLAEEFPHHPKLGGFSDRLDTLVGAIKQFSNKLK